MNTVLEPLEFVLPKREPMSPVMDLSVDLTSLTTTETEPLPPMKSPSSEKVVAVEEPLQTLHAQQTQEAGSTVEPSANQTQPVTNEAEKSIPEELSPPNINDEIEPLSEINKEG